MVELSLVYHVSNGGGTFGVVFKRSRNLSPVGTFVVDENPSRDYFAAAVPRRARFRSFKVASVVVVTGVKVSRLRLLKTDRIHRLLKINLCLPSSFPWEI